MARSSKPPKSPQPRSPLFGKFSAVAVAFLFLFLHLQSGSLAGDPPPPDPRGSWKQVHKALGISRSLGTSPTTPRKQYPTKPSSVYNLPLRLLDSESHRDKADSLQDFVAALRSIPGEPKPR